MLNHFVKMRPEGRKVRPGYWFARKRRGFGAMPATPMGWISTAIFLAALGGAQGILHDRGAKLAVNLSFTAIYLVVCWCKTDGGWGWTWDDRK